MTGLRRIHNPEGSRGKRSRRLPAAAISLVVLLSGCGVVNDGAVLVLDGANVFTATDGQMLPNQRIVIRGNRITDVGPAGAIEAPRGADIRDVRGKWIIPGLIDAHVRAEPWALPEFAAWGVTAIRDLYSDSAAAVLLKTTARAGTMIAPRVYTAGGGIDGTSSAFDAATEVSGDREARRAVGARALGGSDWIAVYTRLTPTLYRSVDAEAEAFRMPIAAYVGAIDAVTAARLGARTIEGLTGIIEATAGNRAYWARAHRDFYDGVREVGGAWATVRNADLNRVADRLAATATVLVPTLVMHETFARFADTLDLLRNMSVDGVPGFVRNRWDIPGLLRDLGWEGADFLALRTARQKQDRFVARFRSAGGTVIVGTGATRPMLPPGSALHRELELLVQAGLTPDEAIVAATRDAAEALLVDSLGTVVPGGVADLVVLDADPTADITNTRRIVAVVLRGRYYTPTEIRQSR